MLGQMHGDALHEDHREHVQQEGQHHEGPEQGQKTPAEACEHRGERAEHPHHTESAQDLCQLQKAHDPHEHHVPIARRRGNNLQHKVDGRNQHQHKVEQVPPHILVNKEEGTVHGHAHQQLHEEKCQKRPLNPREGRGRIHLAQVLHLPICRNGHKHGVEQDDKGAEGPEAPGGHDHGEAAPSRRLLQLLRPLCPRSGFLQHSRPSGLPPLGSQTHPRHISLQDSADVGGRLLRVCRHHGAHLVLRSGAAACWSGAAACSARAPRSPRSRGQRHRTGTARRRQRQRQWALLLGLGPFGLWLPRAAQSTHACLRLGRQRHTKNWTDPVLDGQLLRLECILYGLYGVVQRLQGLLNEGGDELCSEKGCPGIQPALS
mmetsp:Transcript_119885/g.334467  ORF Transcript_119885/g.334467 Transcript_119885/m.334467 type:complete len:374 (+) Transcript_119885:794-1915(+)